MEIRRPGEVNRQRFLKFAISGGTAVVLNIAFLYAFVDLLHIWYLPASVFAFAFSMSAHFLMQKLWAFADREAEGIHVQFFKFLSAALLNLAINSACIYVLVSLLSVNYLLAQTALRIGLAVMNYFLYEIFVFINPLQSNKYENP